RSFDSFKLLMDLRQTTSVREYAQQFLLLKLEVKMEDSILLNLFIKGLKPHTATEVRLREPANVMKAIEYAQIIDDTRFSTRTLPSHNQHRPQNHQTSRNQHHYPRNHQSSTRDHHQSSTRDHYQHQSPTPSSHFNSAP